MRRHDVITNLLAFLIVAMAILVAVTSGASPSGGPWVGPHWPLPPEGEPSVGLWLVDGRPVPAVTVPVAGRYFSYDPGLPVVELFDRPPTWWAPMPGAAP